MTYIHAHVLTHEMKRETTLEDRRPQFYKKPSLVPICHGDIDTQHK